MVTYNGDLSGGSIYPSNGQMFFDASNSYDTRAEGQFYGSTMNSISGTLSNFDSSIPNASVNFSANR